MVDESGMIKNQMGMHNISEYGCGSRVTFCNTTPHIQVYEHDSNFHSHRNLHISSSKVNRKAVLFIQL
jgi:hypothetical protein